MTNKGFKEDEHFKECCDIINLPVTSRQASKFKNERGRAYIEGKRLVKTKPKAKVQVKEKK